MAGISIATIAAIVSAAGSAAGATVAGVNASNAHDAAVDERHKQQQALYDQQKATQDQNAKTDAGKAATMALSRQRALSAAAGGNWGGTLGSGASGAQPAYAGGQKVALGA